MGIQETAFSLRENLLDRLVGRHGQAVLNPPTPESAGRSVDLQYPAREITAAVNAFKALAMDPAGDHVDYARLAESREFRRFKDECIPLLADFDPVTLDSRERRLAFWINLYNALVIDAVISFRIRDSVTEGPLGIFKFFRRAAYRVGGQRLSLEEIEHGILRANRGHPYLPGPQFGSKDPRLAWSLKSVDPRIHFALNCASRSCPPIGVYAPEKIGAQLDLATQNFIHHEVSVDRVEGILSLSKIFQWYGLDFGGRSGVIEFVLRYLPAGPDRDWLQSSPRLKMVYLPYDWRLNR